MTTNMQTIEMLVRAATGLGPLLTDVVFLGGSTTSLLITDPTVKDIRHTLDVDVIINVISRVEYYNLREKLIDLGFKEKHEFNVTCRWLINDVVIDIMPTDENILGFSNIWYPDAILYSFMAKLTDDITIKVVSPPYFIATKIEAFKGRGNGDYASSSDIEDIITVIDGREELLDELQAAPANLKAFLAKSFSIFLKSSDFIDLFPGHLPQGLDTAAREKIALRRMMKIAEL